MRNELTNDGAGDDHNARDALLGVVVPSAVSQQNDNGGEDRSHAGTLPRCVDPAVVSRICLDLIALQAERVFCIKNQSRADRAIEAFIARKIGYHTGLEEADRKKRFKEARAIRLMVEKGGGEDHLPSESHDGVVLSAVSPLVILSANSRQGWDNHRANTEKAMRKTARKLPVFEWVAEVRGFSDLGLAVIIGEAGDLSNYSDPAKLWKRMGLGIVNGKRQGNPGAGATAEDWTAHGYVARRRAEVWAFVDDVMLRAQWRGEKTDSETGEVTPAHPIGPYGEAYARKKLEYIEREHPAPDRAARRYMSKRLLRDLWAAWRAATIALIPLPGLPPSEPFNAGLLRFVDESGRDAGGPATSEAVEPKRDLSPAQSIEPVRKRGRRAAGWAI